MFESQKDLLKGIDEMREKMISSAKETGYTSAETVRFSQELDQLIFKYQTISAGKAVRMKSCKSMFTQLVLPRKKQKLCLHA